MKKISEFSTDAGLDLICNILPNIENIVADEKFRAMLAECADSKLKDFNSLAQRINYGLSKVNIILPYLLKDKRDDLLSIVAALDESSIEKVRSQSMIKTVQDIKSLFDDSDLMQLFHSRAQMGDAKSSGPASAKAE